VTDFKLTTIKAAERDHYGVPPPASAAGLKKVTAAVVAAANVQPGDRVIDLGSGGGQVALALAEAGARVLAVDGNAAALGRLGAAARDRALPDLDILVRPIDCLSLPARSADLIVTSYAMHRLRHVDKDRLVSASFHWLRPGGTLIVADMMFGRGGSRADRVVIRTKVRRLARRGLGGWWRIAKNAYKYLVRVQDHPASISAWTAMFARAGFAQITASSIVNEAGLVIGRRPDEPSGQNSDS
jgi:ubiquinone/menaquinone biosynthesis C-methylase UbiE